MKCNKYLCLLFVLVLLLGAGPGSEPKPIYRPATAPPPDAGYITDFWLDGIFVPWDAETSETEATSSAAERLEAESRLEEMETAEEQPEAESGPEETEPAEGRPQESEPVGESEEIAPSGTPPEESRADVRIMVPSTGQVILNPYRLDVTLDGMHSMEQIVSVPMPIISLSNTAVSVSVSAVGHTAGDVACVGSPPDADAPDKQLFLYLEFQEAWDDSGNAQWEGQFRNAANQLLVTEQERYKADVLTLPAGDGFPAYGAFRVFGAASSAPDQMWTAKDTVNLSAAFTFTPLETEAFRGTAPDAEAAGMNAHFHQYSRTYPREE